MWTDFVFYYNPRSVMALRNDSISSPFSCFCGNTLLFAAQAGIMGDCILKVTLGKRAGIAAS